MAGEGIGALGPYSQTFPCFTSTISAELVIEIVRNCETIRYSGVIIVVGNG